MSAELRNWQSPEKGSEEEKEIVEILKNFSSALRKIPLYPSTHPMVKDSILNLFFGIDSFTKKYGKLSIDIFENSIMICEKTFDAAPGVLKDLLSDFKKIGIEGVAFVPGVLDFEIENFLKIVTSKPEELKAKGGIKAMMLEKDIRAIVLSEVRYARIKDEEQVTKKSEAPGFGEGEGGSGGEGAEEQGSGPGDGAAKEDIVGMVSEFLSGKSDVVPDKDMLLYECKKHSKRLVRQLLKLVGPEKAVEEVLKIIEDRFGKAGISEDDKSLLVEKIKQETLKLQEPKVTKKQLEKELKMLRDENANLKKKLRSVDDLVKTQVETATGELIRENHKIKKEKHRINSVLRHVAEGLVIVDKEGKVLLLNPAAEDLLGVNRENKIGKHILEGLHDEQMVTMSSEKQSEIEIELSGPNEKTKKTIRASTAVIESEEGETIGVVSVLSDITKQKELEKMKNAFVSNVTHDLRAPLISIQKSISLILESAQDAIPQDQKQFLEIANNNAKRLTTLVNDLLDLSKLEAGHMPLDYQETALKTVVEVVFDMLGMWANSRKVSLVREFPEDIVFQADPKLLGQVMTNLVGNAVKFTPSGGSVKITAQDQGKNIQIAVSDTGCGIPKDSLGRIFEKFEQAKAIVPDGAPKGSGLGLAIVKEIVLLHGGKVWVESEEGKGTTFYFTIPKKKEIQDIRD